MSELTRELSELAGQWRIIETTYTLAAAGTLTPIALFNPLRWAIVFAKVFNSRVGDVNVMVTTQTQLADDAGVLLAPSVTPWELNYRSAGGLVQVAWYGTATSAGQKLTVIEVLLQQ